ncbi:ATP-dependent DNA helicase protein [Rhizobium phage RHph_X2_28B]|uniref:ATP-dependent DNA helicase protein n=1 Tax=Rhizobium phage RHph_X2_28B TaxID=2836086 RepID=UPI0023290FC7|nr:ATP-dependent DNA helicase protein [Rhizobium phage RHph_X2_28B]QWY83507.1 ATP-dependent DNA helicase protein [Rhizobium phage RHph_X2_28B]QWY83743.1 ATP-dependent DNA helicase protein [Rhizobium phage RHph_X3_15]
MADLNQGQKAAAEAFFQFLFTPGKGFIISGKAGVGKTFLMSHIIDKVIPQYHETCKLMGITPEFEGVTMNATTNKAAEVLSVATGRPTGTIHSFLALKVTEDFNTGKSYLTKTRDWRVHERQIIFIDECSMIDSELYSILQEGTHQCKIVYVGDHNQLAPVMEKISPVYKQDYPFYELLEPMRNNGQPALMDICAQLRNSVETGEFNPIQIVPGVIEHLDNHEMEQQIDLMFNHQTLDTRILAYTNKRVLQYNDHIRSLRKLPDEFIEGEYLVNNSAVKVGRRMLSVEEEVTIQKIHNRSKIEVVRDVEMEVLNVTLETRLGEYLESQIPVNRPHFAELVKYFARQKNWERYYHLKQNFPDLRQRDSATVHKSQGSTYDSVFIDLGDISTCTHSDQAARMLYVAFSRAKNKVYLYGNLADKYGGLTF